METRISGIYYLFRSVRYLFKFIIPQRASNNSNATPTEKEIDGTPSTTKLIILPDAKPIIKSTFEKVAIRQ